uniref:Uncharacterized protein n=1 Tax=Glossina brevipalpis TaxID=37001 RepID=A0A1A9WTP8_9MUSC
MHYWRQVCLTEFPNLKSLFMSSIMSYECKSILTQMHGIRLQKFSMNADASPVDCLNMLEAQTISLRWLRLTLLQNSEATLKKFRLQEIFKKFVQLEELDIKGVDSIYMEDVLQNVSEENPLKSIAFRISSNDNDWLAFVLRKWSKSLEFIDLWIRGEETVRRLRLASANIRRLEMDAYDVNPHDLVQCIASEINEALIELTLRGVCPMGPLFADLIQRLPNLTKLDLGECNEKPTDEEMRNIFCYLLNLRHLTLPACNDESDIQYLPAEPNISNLKRLRTLQSCLCRFQVLHISNLNFEFKELKELDILHCGRTQSVSKIADYKKYFPALQRLNGIGSDDTIEEIRTSFPRLFFLNGQWLS